MDDFKIPDAPTTVAKNDGVADKVKSSTPAPACPYKVPPWSAAPQDEYKFEVLKSGQIIEVIENLEQKATWTFGRLPDNDMEMAHPTISRYHAVLQYKPTPAEDDMESDAENKSDQPEGWYVYDLGSTHGTFLNKQRLPARVYIRMRVGHMLKLGASTRAFILQGPSVDEEPESDLTVTELRKQREQQIADAAAEEQRKRLEAEERERNEGISWGMAEDADEETDLTHNPFATSENEELFFDDPKRTLRGFFEREGLPLEYKCDEVAQASFVCRVELPLDDSNGRPITVEVSHKGRKKDCVVQCALEACRTLDRYGVLRQANQESLKRRKVKTNDSDDEDEFWDRTGDVARKKQRKANAALTETLTYEDLLTKETELNAELGKVEQEISRYQENEKRLKAIAVKQQSMGDDLENFMNTLSEDVGQVDKIEIKKLRLEQLRIKGEQQKLQRLIKIAKPTSLSFESSAKAETNAQPVEETTQKKQLPMIGKRNQFGKFKIFKSVPIARPKTSVKAFDSDNEQIEEVEEEEDESEEIPSEKPSEEIEKEMQIRNANDDIPLENIVSSASNLTESCVETEALPAFVDASTIEEASATQSGEDEAAQKKRRQRLRVRNKQRVEEELAEHEDIDKYAKWVPPSNQSGDGITHLNDKFGY